MGCKCCDKRRKPSICLSVPSWLDIEENIDFSLKRNNGSKNFKTAPKFEQTFVKGAEYFSTLEEGLVIDKATGIVTGRFQERQTGEYEKFTVTRKGKVFNKGKKCNCRVCHEKKLKRKRANTPVKEFLQTREGSITSTEYADNRLFGKVSGYVLCKKHKYAMFFPSEVDCKHCISEASSKNKAYICEDTQLGLLKSCNGLSPAAQLLKSPCTWQDCEDYKYNPRESFCLGCKRSQVICERCKKKTKLDDFIQGKYCFACYEPPDFLTGTRSLLAYDGLYGLEVETSDYTVPFKEWKIVDDGSCGDSNGGNRFGKEYVSKPFFNTDRGIDEYEELNQKISLAGKYNEQCGLHFHLSAHKLRWKDLRRLALNFYRMQDILIDTLPESREENYFCKWLPPFYRKQLGQTRNALEFWTAFSSLNGNLYSKGSTNRKRSKGMDSSSLRSIFKSNYHECRYFALNFHSVHKIGTVEFRYLPIETPADELAGHIDLMHILINSPEKVAIVDVISQLKPHSRKALSL